MELTKRERETFDLVTNYRKNNPGAPNAEVFKATGTNTATLHMARKKLGLINKPNEKKPITKSTRPYKMKKPREKRSQAPVMQTIVAPEQAPQNFAVIICNRNNIQDVLNAIS